MSWLRREGACCSHCVSLLFLQYDKVPDIMELRFLCFMVAEGSVCSCVSWMQKGQCVVYGSIAPGFMKNQILLREENGRTKLVTSG